MVQFQVPDGFFPGMQMLCPTPDGNELKLTVPDGVLPGSIMALTQTPSGDWAAQCVPLEWYTDDGEDPVLQVTPAAVPLNIQSAAMPLNIQPAAVPFNIQPSRPSYTPPSQAYTGVVSQGLSQFTYKPMPASSVGPVVYSHTANGAQCQATVLEQRPSYAVIQQNGSRIQEQRPSYTPPAQGYVVDQRPSWVTADALPLNIQPAAVPLHIHPSRPSYTPPAQVTAAAAVPLNIQPAAVPLNIQPNRPSYTPPAQVTAAAVPLSIQPSRPSYTPPSQGYVVSSHIRPAYEQGGSRSTYVQPTMPTCKRATTAPSPDKRSYVPPPAGVPAAARVPPPAGVRTSPVVHSTPGLSGLTTYNTKASAAPIVYAHTGGATYPATVMAQPPMVQRHSGVFLSSAGAERQRWVVCQ